MQQYNCISTYFYDIYTINAWTFFCCRIVDVAKRKDSIILSDIFAFATSALLLQKTYQKH